MEDGPEDLLAVVGVVAVHVAIGREDGKAIIFAFELALNLSLSVFRERVQRHA